MFSNNDAQSVREHTQQRREKKNARAHTLVCAVLCAFSLRVKVVVTQLNLDIDDLRAGEITR